MKTTRVSTLMLIAITLTLAATNANAQHHRSGSGSHGSSRYGSSRLGSGYHGPSYRIDSHSNIIRDSHGSTIGRYNRNIIHQNSTYILPHTGGQHHGTYYVQEGRHFYYPQTVSTGSAHHSTIQPRSIPFGGFSQVDDLAGRLETLANQLCIDLHYNYSHNPGFQEVYREAYQILETAKYIHVAKHQHDHAAVQQRLGSVDRLFHHVQGEVRGWSSDHHRQVSGLGILSQMDLMESTLHHLLNDVGVRPAPVAGGGHTPPPARGGILAPPPNI